MDRKTFLKTSLKCAAGCMMLQAGADVMGEETAKAASSTTGCDAAFLRGWITDFVGREEKNINRDTLVKLMEERGRACCRALEFRQEMIRESKGDVNKLVELMAKRVGPENSVRTGNTVTLIYPVKECVCGISPKRPSSPDDPYCDCSKANNQEIFRIVSGKPVTVEVAESVRRGGSHCKFIIHLS